MQVLIVGTGKLAKELQGSLTNALPWPQGARSAQRSVVIHAGSGRELQSAMDFCEQTQSILVELATGSNLGASPPRFPVVVCPNTNILMLKFMRMLAHSAPLLRPYRIEITESHQAEKKSVPGTAVNIAQSLGLAPEDVCSIRDPDPQTNVLQIPAEHLARHAYHQIRVHDGACSLAFEARVYGDTAYADGVAQIIAATQKHPLENRVYSILEFVDRAWL